VFVCLEFQHVSFGWIQTFTRIAVNQFNFHKKCSHNILVCDIAVVWNHLAVFLKTHKHWEDACCFLGEGL
jgi:hypothetical protein